ncbi:MAG TPA: Wzz/FepE/Etk N-terminal domain-containing protein [Thermodesulfobacteriota bacterium]|nr:Wzz/FepE/Etk N-terminal domain-containing protein [Thermodesulfobacteriota bacterium]
MGAEEKRTPLDDDIDLREYWKALAARKRLVGLVVGVCFSASVVVSLLLPKTYASTASVLPPQDDSTLAPTLLSQLPSSLTGIASGLLGTSLTSDTWVGILGSQTVRDEIIRRFNLREVYGDDYIEDVRTDLGKAVTIDETKEGIVTVTVEDRDPKRAADMANAFIEELDRVNKKVATTSGGRIRVFVKRRLEETEKDLAGAEEEIKAFQEKNGAVRLDDQSKAIIDAIGAVKGQLMAKEVELQTLLSYATPNNPNVQVLSASVSELKGQLRDLEQGKRVKGKSIFIPTDKFPDLTLQYARLLRDAKVQETLFELLTQQYEMARIQEAKDSPTVQVLDTAKPAEKKAGPKRTLIVAVSTLLSLILAAGAALFIELGKRPSSRDTHA